MVKDTRPFRLGGWLAGGSVTAGLGALIGASCCVLPLLLAQAGLGAALSAQLGLFAQARPYLLAVAALLILTGFGAAYWGGRKPRPIVLALLVAATLLAIGAFVMPYVEGKLLEWIGG